MSRSDPPGFADAIDRFALESGFSGVVRVDRDGSNGFAKAYGLANRALGTPNSVDTRFATASASKGLTALVVMRLVELGEIALKTTARSVLGEDLRLIDDHVTVEHLLAHRSGIGDYLDEDETGDDVDAFATYPLPVAVNELARTEQFVPILDGHPTKFAPGASFSYCNGGFVVLALITERVTGTSFHDLVRSLVCEPAGMHHTEFLRSDELPAGVALGYLAPSGLRTNVFHLPVRGNGDGGVYSTVADVHQLWDAFFTYRIVSPDSVETMTEPRSDVSDVMQYGLGFWIRRGGGVQLEGADVGVSFRSVCDRAAGYTYTVISNDTDGAWPISRRLSEHFAR